jgi:multisubunit Na+/H+ antiporter MnhB subunit
MSQSLITATQFGAFSPIVAITLCVLLVAFILYGVNKIFESFQGPKENAIRGFTWVGVSLFALSLSFWVLFHAFLSNFYLDAKSVEAHLMDGAVVFPLLLGILLTVIGAIGMVYERVYGDGYEYLEKIPAQPKDETEEAETNADHN